jgi:lipoprotein-anchoring transpeptidase ErfK/SrfK
VVETTDFARFLSRSVDRIVTRKWVIPTIDEVTHRSLPRRFSMRTFVVAGLVVSIGCAAPSLAQTDGTAPPAEAAPAPSPEPAPAPEPAPQPAADPGPTPDNAAAEQAAAKKKAAAKKAAARKAAAKKKAAARKAAAAKQSSSIGSVPRGSTLLDVDISSQTMRIYKAGKLYRTVPVSTGSGRRYCEKGKCGVAVTPRGTFRIYNHIRGWRTAQLGRLYNPLYFRGGYAIHGGALPGYPASHGCVRVSYSVAAWLPSVAPIGSTVRIRN